MERTAYSDIGIHFTIDGITIHASNIIFECLTRTIPSHSHGNGCYEIHYISQGYGQLSAENAYYNITPETLYVTGPHIEHAQSPLLSDPMQEYCVYLKATKPSHLKETSALMDFFLSTHFWFGKAKNGIHAIMKQLFEELEQKKTGYRKQVELLLSQLLIALIRNYELQQADRERLLPDNLADRASIIIEECFLYEYSTISLKELSERIRLSPRQTQRLIQECYGKTFQQKKADARMSAAVILLKMPEKNISVIADELGYSSPEHFSSAFHQYYHMSPREYRKTFFSEN